MPHNERVKASSGMIKNGKLPNAIKFNVPDSIYKAFFLTL